MAFHHIDGSAVILRKRGLYLQSTVYSRDRESGLYVKHGSGFLAMYAAGGTTDPNVSWEDLELQGDATTCSGKFNRLMLGGAK